MRAHEGRSDWIMVDFGFDFSIRNGIGWGGLKGFSVE
jgi:hypothetical protein